MKQNIGKWIAIAVLVIFLFVIIRGYIVQLQESNEDKEIKDEIIRTRLTR